MYIIERVSGIKFKKDVEHRPYKLTQWQHTGWEMLVGAVGMSAAAGGRSSHRAGSSRPSSHHMSRGSKLKELLKKIFCMCQYAVDAAYEGRKDINDMRRQMGLVTREIPPPPVFPPYEDSREDELEMDLPHDRETLCERMSSIRRERGQTKPQRHTTTTHRAGRAIVSDSDEESDERIVLGSRQQIDPADDDDSDIGSD
jgi:hypothetical protein